MDTVHLQAKVVPGRGNASRERQSDLQQLSKLLQKSIVPGSLNLSCHSPIWLDTKRAIFSNGRYHYFWQASLNGLPVIVNRWIGSCPAHIFEIYADTHLRSTFQLCDGDYVRLSFNSDLLDKAMSMSGWSRLVWSVLWKWREVEYYRDGLYYRTVLQRRIRRFFWRAFQM